MGMCGSCPVWKTCKADVCAGSKQCVYYLTGKLTDAFSLIEEYRAKGEPDKLVRPVHCGQCGLYHIDSYTCAINGDEWAPDNYCSYGRPIKLGA